MFGASRGAGPDLGHRPGAAGKNGAGAGAFPRFDVPEEHSTDTYFEYVARQGFEGRRPRIEALIAAGRLKQHRRNTPSGLDREIRMIQQMKFSGTS